MIILLPLAARACMGAEVGKQLGKPVPIRKRQNEGFKPGGK